MKELSKYSRLAGSFEKLFDKLNNHFFNGELPRVVITIQSTPNAYGHYSTFDAWSVKGEGFREINLGAGTIGRPIEYTCATLLHEMVHLYDDVILGVKDCSGSGSYYHNKAFKRSAESHGLICTHGKYGWSDTSSVLSDELLEFVLDNELQSVLMTRNDPSGIRIAGGSRAANGAANTPPRASTGSHNYRFQCPNCRAIARASKPLRLICADCMTLMV